MNWILAVWSLLTIQASFDCSDLENPMIAVALRTGNPPTYVLYAAQHSVICAYMY